MASPAATRPIKHCVGATLDRDFQLAEARPETRISALRTRETPEPGAIPPTGVPFDKWNL